MDKTERFQLLTAHSYGRLKTMLVHVDAFAESLVPADFFLPGATEIKDHGTVEISGEKVHMLDDIFESQ